jgi:hypothetical protein
VLLAFTRNSIGQTRSNWTHGPPQAEQEKMLKEHWAVLWGVSEEPGSP